MTAKSLICVTHWFAGTNARQRREIRPEELTSYLENLRNLKAYSAALRVAVDDVEIDLGVRPTHTW